MSTKNPAATKEEWLTRCAAYLTSRAGLSQDDADQLADTIFDNCVKDEGDEASVLADWTPEDAAMEELSYWSE